MAITFRHPNFPLPGDPEPLALANMRGRIAASAGVPCECPQSLGYASRPSWFQGYREEIALARGPGSVLWVLRRFPVSLQRKRTWAEEPGSSSGHGQRVTHSAKAR